uniref:Uncharacterized protein n=1 Tax=Meloidogyne javanica TaxID=6303 RepID=A0A915LH67_MELJA
MKRSEALILPEPQISDKELEDIIKIGHISDSVRELVDDNPSSTLLHDYNESARMNAFSARTQRAAVGDVDTFAEELLHPCQRFLARLVTFDIRMPILRGAHAELFVHFFVFLV